MSPRPGRCGDSRSGALGDLVRVELPRPRHLQGNCHWDSVCASTDPVLAVREAEPQSGQTDTLLHLVPTPHGIARLRSLVRFRFAIVHQKKEGANQMPQRNLTPPLFWKCLVRILTSDLLAP
ncbi:hypothetical protein VTI74DRAFT_339 [Chaetomium olivicolor]